MKPGETVPVTASFSCTLFRSVTPPLPHAVPILRAQTSRKPKHAVRRLPEALRRGLCSRPRRCQSGARQWRTCTAGLAHLLQRSAVGRSGWLAQNSPATAPDSAATIAMTPCVPAAQQGCDKNMPHPAGAQSWRHAGWRARKSGRRRAAQPPPVRLRSKLRGDRCAHQS